MRGGLTLKKDSRIERSNLFIVGTGLELDKDSNGLPILKSTAAGGDHDLGDHADTTFTSVATGDIIYRGSGSPEEWVNLAVGTSSQVLIGGTTPSWASVPAHTHDANDWDAATWTQYGIVYALSATSLTTTSAPSVSGGDLIYSPDGSSWAPLNPPGSTKWLKHNGTIPSWADLPPTSSHPLATGSGDPHTGTLPATDIELLADTQVIIGGASSNETRVLTAADISAGTFPSGTFIFSGTTQFNGMAHMNNDGGVLQRVDGASSSRWQIDYNVTPNQWEWEVWNEAGASQGITLTLDADTGIWDFATGKLTVNGSTVDPTHTHPASDITTGTFGAGDFSFQNTVKVDTVTEYTTDAGVTIESVSMEDGVVSTAGNIISTGGNIRSEGGMVQVYRIGDTADAVLRISGDAGYDRLIQFYSGNIRWEVMADNTAEGGSNAGSDFVIHAYNDAGGSLDDAVRIIRSSQEVQIKRQLTLDYTAGVTALKVDGASSARYEVDYNTTPNQWEWEVWNEAGSTQGVTLTLDSDDGIWNFADGKLTLNGTAVEVTGHTHSASEWDAATWTQYGVVYATSATALTTTAAASTGAILYSIDGTSWSVLAAGTEDHVLTMGPTTPGWEALPGTADHQLATSGGPHTGSLPLSDLGGASPSVVLRATTAGTAWEVSDAGGVGEYLTVISGATNPVAAFGPLDVGDAAAGKLAIAYGGTNSNATDLGTQNEFLVYNGTRITASGYDQNDFVGTGANTFTGKQTIQVSPPQLELREAASGVSYLTFDWEDTTEALTFKGWDSTDNPLATWAIDFSGTGDVTVGGFECSGTIQVDTVTEKTASAGVTIETLLIEDGELWFANNKRIIFNTSGGDTRLIQVDGGDDVYFGNSGATNFDDMYFQVASGHSYYWQIAATTEMSLDASSLNIDAINEYTADAGVTVESVKLEDGGITGGSQLGLVRNVDNDLIVISGGNGTTSGGNIQLVGGTHGSAANDINLRSGSSTKLSWDDDANKWIIPSSAELSTSSQVTLGNSSGVLLRVEGASNARYEIDYNGTPNQWEWEIWNESDASQGVTLTLDSDDGVWNFATGKLKVNGSDVLTGNHTHPASDITSGTFGSGSFTFPDNLTVQDTFTVGGNFAGIRAVDVAANSGQYRGLRIYTNDGSASLRWWLYADTVAEGTGDAGSDLRLGAYDNSGSYLTEAFAVTRATGDVTFGNNVRVNGGILYTDDIQEDDSGSGVTIDGVLLKDNDVNLPGGAGVQSQAQNNYLFMSGDSSGATIGANIWLYGSTHGSSANDILIRSDSNEVLEWDDSLNLWNIAGKLSFPSIGTGKGFIKRAVITPHMFENGDGLGGYNSVDITVDRLLGCDRGPASLTYSNVTSGGNIWSGDWSNSGYVDPLSTGIITIDFDNFPGYGTDDATGFVYSDGVLAIYWYTVEANYHRQPDNVKLEVYHYDQVTSPLQDKWYTMYDSAADVADNPLLIYTAGKNYIKKMKITIDNTGSDTNTECRIVAIKWFSHRAASNTDRKPYFQSYSNTSQYMCVPSLSFRDTNWNEVASINGSTGEIKTTVIDTGSGTAMQLQYNNATKLTIGNSICTFADDLNVDGDQLILGGNVNVSEALKIQRNSGYAADIYFQTQSSNRWILRGATSDAESTGDAGSNFSLYSYDDGGSFLRTNLNITRSNGDFAVTGSMVTFNLSTYMMINDGDVYIDRQGEAVDAALWLRGDAGENRIIWMTTDTDKRWAIYTDTTAESEPSSGSDFRIARYNNAGSYTDTPFYILRDTGNVRLCQSAGDTIIGADPGGTQTLRVTGAGKFTGALEWGTGSAITSSDNLVQNPMTSELEIRLGGNVTALELREHTEIGGTYPDGGIFDSPELRFTASYDTLDTGSNRGEIYADIWLDNLSAEASKDSRLAFEVDGTIGLYIEDGGAVVAQQNVFAGSGDLSIKRLPGDSEAAVFANSNRVIVGEHGGTGAWHVGPWTGGSTTAALHHDALIGTANAYTLVCNSSGQVALNSASGQSGYLRVNNANALMWDGTEIKLYDSVTLNTDGNLNIGTSTVALGTVYSRNIRADSGQSFTILSDAGVTAMSVDTSDRLVIGTAGTDSIQAYHALTDVGAKTSGTHEINFDLGNVQFWNCTSSAGNYTFNITNEQEGSGVTMVWRNGSGGALGTITWDSEIDWGTNGQPTKPPNGEAVVITLLCVSATETLGFISGDGYTISDT